MEKYHDIKNTVVAGSKELLADQSCSFGDQSFILSEKEAEQVGAAIANRDHIMLHDVVGDLIDQVTNDYIDTDALDYSPDWDAALRKSHGPGAHYGRLFEHENYTLLLNELLVHESQEELGLDDVAYLKMLETTAILSMPSTGYVNPPESRRSRKGIGYKPLYNRAISMLNSHALHGPGIRTVREGILSQDTQSLDTYIASTVRSHNAQNSLARIVTMTPEEVVSEKKRLLYAVSGDSSELDIDYSDQLHILQWNMLDGSQDRDTQRDIIRRIIEDQPQTEQQREKTVRNWEPERIDFLIGIAEAATLEGRNPNIYISSRFNTGSGVYIAVELEHPHDKKKKIVFADNPLAGNALYIVDEMKLQNEGRPASWPQVLGSSRKVARQKGATRKYHTKDWQDIVPKILSMGEVQQEPVVPQAYSEVSVDELRLANDRLSAVLKATRNLLAETVQNP